MLQKLKELIFGKPPLEVEHAYFGNIIYMGGDVPEDNDYWEAEKIITGIKEPLTVLINATKEGPSDKHIAFYEDAISDLDALFEKCWPIFEPDFKQWTGKEFSGNWRDYFELMSLEIPKDADENNEWTVSYYVDLANHYFTARFINGNPKFNEIDG
jgi:hypothetical protein